jgi:peroxidase
MNHTVRNRPTNRKPNVTPQRRRCRPCLEPLEERCLLSVNPTIEFRPINEMGNNTANPTWGAQGTDLLRVSPVAYADGISSPSLPNDPSARVISDIVNNQDDPNNPGQDLETIDQNGLSDFGYVWGQFIDHDMDLTPTNPNETLQILADPNDPSQMGNQTFERSVFDPNTGTSTRNPRQQTNAITAYLDLSNVYGSTQAVADALRTHSGGLLKTSPGNMLPYNNSTYFTADQLAALNMANDSGAVPSTSLFAAGDVRANENSELTALQTLFVRNHNTIATELAQMNPAKFGFTSWTDENLYQEARKLNIAEEEMITYTEYLPDVLGPNALPAYTGYKPNVNAGIATEFSTIAFRFGHSLLDADIERHDNNGANITGDPTGDPSLSLATDFFDPNVLNPAGVIDPLTGHISTDIDAYLKANADGDANAMDVLATNAVRNLLFANGGLQDNGQDLIARDIERARDDGIGTYNQVRVAYGLPAVTRFSQITSNVTVQNELQQAYGSVNNIDPFEGGLAEDHVAGSDMGPLFTAILAKQFAALRDGDRFFYLNERFTPQEQSILNQGNTLTKVIEANTHITNMQADAFRFTASISGTVFNDLNGNGVQDAGEGALSGRVVELEDSDGEVLATRQTDSNGRYAFSNLDGISTGQFQVLAVPPNNVTITTPNPVTVTFTRGDQSFTVNFGEVRHIRSDSTTAAALTDSSGTGGVLAPSSADWSSAAPTASGVDTTQTATLATALADSTGSGTTATPQGSAPAGQASGAGSTSSVWNQNTVVYFAKHGKAYQAANLLSGAAWDAQDTSAP